MAEIATLEESSMMFSDDIEDDEWDNNQTDSLWGP
jgi:hypothetical protein